MPSLRIPDHPTHIGGFGQVKGSRWWDRLLLQRSAVELQSWCVPTGEPRTNLPLRGLGLHSTTTSHHNSNKLSHVLILLTTMEALIHDIYNNTIRNIPCRTMSKTMEMSSKASNFLLLAIHFVQTQNSLISNDATV